MSSNPTSQELRSPWTGTRKVESRRSKSARGRVASASLPVCTLLFLSLSLSPLELDSSSWAPTLSEAGSSSSPVLQGDFVS